MSKSVELIVNETDKDFFKNITDFLYESITNFKNTLNDLGVSISNLLNSLNTIEKQLGNQGYSHPQSSSDSLYERLVQNKQEREKKQKELINKLTRDAIPSQIPNIIPPNKENQQSPQIPTLPKESSTPKPLPSNSQKGPKIQTPPKIEKVPMPDPKAQLTNLDNLKTEMLDYLRRLKKVMKGQADKI